MELMARPLIDGEPMRAGVLSRKISEFFEKRLERLIHTTLVLPGCEGISLPGLLGVQELDPTAARTPGPVPRPMSTQQLQRAPLPIQVDKEAEEEEEDKPRTRHLGASRGPSPGGHPSAFAQRNGAEVGFPCTR